MLLTSGTLYHERRDNMIKVTGSIQTKNGMLYALLNYKDENGKRKVKWISTGLAEKDNKRKAQRMLPEIILKFEEELETQDEKGSDKQDFIQFLYDYLKIARHNVTQTTYMHYKRMVDGRIKAFFEPLKLKIDEVTATHINKLCESILLDGCKTNTAIRYRGLIMVAFEYAFKNDMVTANPCAKSQRPKKNAYYAGFYSKEELNQLLKVAKDDQLYVPITLAAYYGLRRSEVIGVKWSNIDFDAKRINIWHKVMQEEMEEGGTQIVGYDTMKNKSSRRTMPLIPAVEKILLEHKAKQEEYMKLFGNSYSKEYKDYVCVDPLGGIIKPNFVTEHFRHLLEEHGLKRIRFHDLRHTCASLLLANGISMKQIQEWLGHSDFSTTANIYAHLEYDTKLQSAEMMAKVIGYED